MQKNCQDPGGGQGEEGMNGPSEGKEDPEGSGEVKQDQN